MTNIQLTYMYETCYCSMLVVIKRFSLSAAGCSLLISKVLLIFVLPKATQRTHTILYSILLIVR